MDVFPAFKSNFGDWTYYVTTMKLKEVASKVMYADNLEYENTISLKLQRDRQEKRSESIVRYLKYRNDRFFGSIIVAAVTPEESDKSGFDFFSMEIPDDVIESNPALKFGMSGAKDKFDKMGLVVLKDGVEYYALDGQHRLGAIINIFRSEGDEAHSNKMDGDTRTKLLNEDVSVILIDQPIPRSQTDKEVFFKRYKSLFSTLNRYAKPTDASTNILMDENDGFAILTKRFLSDYRLVKYNRENIDQFPKVKLTGGPNISPTSSYFTSLVVLHQSNIELLKSRKRDDDGWEHTYDHDEDDIRRIPLKNPISDNEDLLKKWAHTPPDDEILDEYFDELTIIWDGILKVWPEIEKQENWSSMTNDNKLDDLPSHPILRPVVLKRLCRTIREAIDRDIIDHDKEFNSDNVATTLLPLKKKIKWDLFEYPFKNLIWAPSDRNYEWDEWDDQFKSCKMVTSNVDLLFEIIEMIVFHENGGMHYDDDAINFIKSKWKQKLAVNFVDTTTEDKIWQQILDMI